MKKFALLTAVLALGTLSLALAKPIVPKEQEKPKGPPAVDQLAPKMVNLNLDNVSVVDAVNELTRQSGYPIQLQGDQAVLRSRMITLKTGEVSFFQALDMLCRKGNLVEVSNALTVRPANPGINPGGGANVQPAPGGAQAVPGGVAPGAQIKIEVQIQPNGGIQIQPEPKADPQPVPVPQPKANKGANGGGGKLQAQAQQGKAQVQPAAKIQPRPIIRPNQITLTDGKPAELPTFYAGAVRIRMLSSTAMNMPVQPGETLLVFELTAEPRLQSFNVVGTATITKALDDASQSLSVVVDAPAIVPGVLPGAPPQVPQLPAVQQLPAQAQPGIAQPMIARPNFGLTRIVTVRLKSGAKEARQIKELNGTVNVQVLGQPEAVLKIDNVLQGKAQSVNTKDNSAKMILDAMEKAGDVYRAQVIMEYATKANPNPQPNGVATLVMVGSTVALPSLVDADGKVYQMRITSSKFENAKNAGDPMRRTYTIEYSAGAGQGQPTSLVVNQTRLVQVPIAFEFANVPVR